MEDKFENIILYLYLYISHSYPYLPGAQSVKKCEMVEPNDAEKVQINSQQDKGKKLVTNKESPSIQKNRENNNNGNVNWALICPRLFSKCSLNALPYSNPHKEISRGRNNY